MRRDNIINSEPIQSQSKTAPLGEGSSIAGAHSRLHSMVNANDHAPVAVADYGKTLRTNLTTGKWELVAWPTGGGTVTGTENFLSKFGAAGVGLENSLFWDNGVSAGILTTLPTRTLDVNGTFRVRALTEQPTFARVLVADESGHVDYILKSSLEGGTTVTGTENRVSKFGAGGIGVVDSQTIDDGVNIGVGIAPQLLHKYTVLSTIDSGTAIFAKHESIDEGTAIKALVNITSGDGSATGIHSEVTGAVARSGYNFAAYLSATGAGTLNFAIYATAGNNYMAGNLAVGVITGTRTVDVNGTLRVRTITEQNAYTRVLVADSSGNVDYILKSALTPIIYTTGAGLIENAPHEFAHADTSTLASGWNVTPGNFVSGFDFDTFGHTTAIRQTALPVDAGGTVTSVGLLLPTPEFSITNSPVTGAGTLTAAWKSQTQKTVLAAPAAANGTPTFRRLDIYDLSNLSTTAKLVGTGASSAVLSEITIGAGLAMSGTTLVCTVTPGTGTVTSVTLSAPVAEFTVQNPTITTAGVISLLWNNQSGGVVFCSPQLGQAAGPPSFRKIVLTDIQALTTYSRLIGSASNGLEVQEITLGTGLSMTGNVLNATTGGGGTVTSVGLSMPAGIFEVANSPVTGAGTLTATFSAQAQHSVLAAPPTTSGLPYFRRLEINDLQPINASKLVGTSTTEGRLQEITIGSGLSMSGTTLVCTVTPGTGTVTSVDLSMPAAEFSVANSPITTSGIIQVAWNAQPATYVFAAPKGIPGGTPTFRKLAITDFDFLSNSARLVGSPSDGEEVTEITLGTGLAMSGQTLVCTVTPGGSGTVTSVGLAMPPAEFSVSNTPVINAGTFSVSWNTQTNGYALIARGFGVPQFSQMTINDIAAINSSKLVGTSDIEGRLQEITLGTNLSMSGSTLNAAGAQLPADIVYDTDFLNEGLLWRAQQSGAYNTLFPGRGLSISGASQGSFKLETKHTCVNSFYDQVPSSGTSETTAYVGDIQPNSMAYDGDFVLTKYNGNFDAVTGVKYARVYVGGVVCGTIQTPDLTEQVYFFADLKITRRQGNQLIVNFSGHITNETGSVHKEFAQVQIVTVNFAASIYVQMTMQGMGGAAGAVNAYTASLDLYSTH